MAQAYIEVRGGEALVAASNALRLIDKKLPGDLRLLLRRAAAPIIREQKSAIRSLHVKGPRSTGLRRKVAVGTQLQLRTGSSRKGARMRIITKMDHSLAWAPRALDTGAPGGGHWESPRGGGPVRRVGGASWFMGPAGRNHQETHRKIHELLKSTATMVARQAAIARSTRG